MRITLIICVPVAFFLGILSCTQTPVKKKYKIGFSQCTMFDDWRKAMVNEMNRELIFHDDVELVLKDAEGDNGKQISQIQQLIDEKSDLLIVSPNEAEPITPIVEKIYKSGIPVIILDRRINSTSYTAYVGSDNKFIGEAIGHYMANLLKGKGNILEIWGLKGSTPFIDRDKGFKKAISQYPDIHVTPIKGDWGIKRDAESTFRKLILENNRYDAVFAHNDIMALAANRIYQDMHINKPLSFVGVDGLAGPDGGMENVSNGVLKATALYPTGGDKAIQVATDILRSRSFEKENLLKTTIIDSTNVFVMQMQGEKILSQQRDILRQESKNQEQIKIYYSQRTLIYILLTGLVMLIVVSTIAIFSWREKIEINKRLEANSKEISNQRDTIAEIAHQAEVATNEKLKFFTNISHEFKTPLTLIMGPVELLLAKGAEIQSQSRESALLIQKNALRLLRLVNQLMDFRKIEDKKMVMHVAEIDLIPFIQDIVAAFDDMAKKRKILFEFKSDIKKLPAFFDPDMLDKVIFNLLSNAFKFTKDKGIIRMSVSLDSKAKNTFIFIEDNGEGMSPESVQHAFDRFYTGEHLGGTGLGLSLSKEFMDLHHGNLSLTSEKGKGTRFCIMVPLGMDHFEPNQILSSIPDYSRSQSYDAIIQDQVERYQSSPEHEGSHEHSVLIIEDNKELRTFLKGQLNRFYDVQEASDGPEGIRIAFEGVPDIIITDVKLPGKDGFEVSRILKQDLRTSHIPIIILTAKGTAEQKIVGIQTGADDYITKPFVFEFLVEKIKALIKTREALREHYSQDLKIGQPVFASRGLDKKFINDFRALVEKNIANPDFNVNDFGPELGMSRIQIYRKVKALIGYSVNDYVIDARLKKAQYLLLHTNRTIAEISSEVGFSSPNYFSTTFKSKFNLSPKEYKIAHFSAN